MYRTFGLACGLLMGSAGLASAQVTTTTTTTTTAPAGSVRVSQILGSTVHLQGTNDFGKVDDILLGQDGSPTYLLVSSGGRQAMFPYNGGNFDFAQRAVNYDVTPQAVQPLLFNQGAVPNVADPGFTSRTSQAFPNAGNGKIKIKEKANGAIKEKIKPF